MIVGVDVHRGVGQRNVVGMEESDEGRGTEVTVFA